MSDSDLIHFINEHGVSALFPLIVIILWNARMSIGAFFSQTIRKRLDEISRRDEILNEIATYGLQRDDKHDERIFALLTGTLTQLTEQLNRLNSVLIALELRSSQMTTTQETLARDMIMLTKNVEAALKCKENGK